jgi:hypothetical protein
MEQARVKDQVREIAESERRFHLKRRPSTSGVLALVVRRMRGARYNAPDVIQYASQFSA